MTAVFDFLPWYRERMIRKADPDRPFEDEVPSPPEAPVGSAFPPPAEVPAPESPTRSDSEGRESRAASPRDPDPEAEGFEDAEIRLSERGEEVPAVHPFMEGDEEDERRLSRTLEAVLFASTEALGLGRLSEVLGVPASRVKEALEALEERLDREGRPYECREHGGAWRLYTRQEFYPFLLRLKRLRRVERLTPAALETLAIIAYRQPVIRAEIEAIRGVKVGPMLRALLDRKLIRVLGRAEVPGAPFQYGTTRSFLDRFGLSSLEDLPSLREFQQGRI